MVDVYTEKIGDVWFGVVYENETVYGTGFARNETRVFEGLSDAVKQDLSKQEKKKTRFAESVIEVLKNMYNGKDVSHDLRTRSNHLSKYAMTVMDAVSKVPVGYVTSYGNVAKAVGGGPRAVGQIMARNPFAPICPCQRVVKSDLTLGGYGGGLDMKIAFLKRERRGYKSEKEIALDHGKLLVFPVERVIEKVEKK